MFQGSCQNVEDFSRNSYFQVGGLHVRVRVLIIVCAHRYLCGVSLQNNMSTENT